jgi:hypothetical protein
VSEAECDSSGLDASASTGNGAAVGDTARHVVSGLYAISKVSWNVMTPLIRRAYTATLANPQHTAPGIPSREDLSGADESSDKSSTTSSVPTTGGAVLVLDLGGSKPSRYTEEGGILGDTSTLPILTHFTAHATNVSTMTFSPSGLLLASADVNGQVILVHSLVPSGMLGPARAIVKPKAMPSQLSPPQLLYKLVRGLSLARIVDIGFDDRQSVVFASSLNGTVHVFDLWQTAIGDSSGGGGDGGGRSLASSWSQSSRGNSYSDAGTSPAMDLAMLSHGGSGSGGHNGHSNGTPHGVWSNMSTSQENSQFPVTNVSLFLQMTKPNMRALQGYSDQRVSLPMRDLPLQSQSLPPADGQSTEAAEANGSRGIGGEVSRGGTNSSSTFSSTLFSEVNIYSKCVIYSSVDVLDTANGSSDGAAQSMLNGSYELLAGTSEGLLSRYRVVTKSAVSGSTVSPVVKEINRWDLCSPISTASSGSNGSEDGASTSTACSVQSASSNGNGTTSASLSAHLSLAGHSSAHVVDPPPLWMRPQVLLRHYTEPPAASTKSGSAAASKFSLPANGDEEQSPSSSGEDHSAALAAAPTTTASTGNGKKKKKNKDSASAAPLPPQETSNGNTSSQEATTPNSSCKQTDRSVDYTCASDSVRLFFPERVRAYPLASSTTSYVYMKDSRRYVSSHGRSSSIPIYPVDANGGSQHGYKSYIDPRIESAVSGSLTGFPLDAPLGRSRGIAITRRARTPEQLSAWEVEEDWTGDELASRIIDYDDEMFKDDDHAEQDATIGLDGDARMG